jgi:DNA polymerase/3'-5' exonuclease PolX
VVCMSTKNPPIPAVKGQRIADRLIERLTPACHSIAVVGSLRRGKPHIHDVDPVLNPILSEPEGMLPGMGTPTPSALQHELAAIIQGSHGAVSYSQNGDKIKTLIVLYQQQMVSVDLYIATPQIWACLLLIRTGSAQHNISLARRATAMEMQLHADGSGLSYRGQKLPCPTEESIFAHLELPYREPHEREVDHA